MPEVDGDWTLEHTHRYLLACEYSWNKTVLDIACGDGYGTRMLADTAIKVLGVDISLDTLSRAAIKYPHPRISFLQGNITAIPLASNSVDLVTSFETIEHLEQHDVMLTEICRVLRPDGMLIISSPDKHEYSDLTGYKNLYHVKELYKDEFEHLLQRYFPHTHILGQRVVFGSVMGAEDEGAFFSWNKGQHARSVGLSQAEYIIALAGKTSLPRSFSSIVKAPLENSNRVNELKKLHDGSLEAAYNYIHELESNLESNLSTINELKTERDSLEFDVNWLKQWKERAHTHMDELNAQIESQRLKIHHMHLSRSWRITAPLRYTATWLRHLRAHIFPKKRIDDKSSVGTWPPDVRALQDKVTLEQKAEASTLSLGVFVHIYYTDLTKEILSYLRNIPKHAKIHISTDSDEKLQEIKAAFTQADLMHRTCIRICPNHGWDIAPFLVGFADEIPNYSLLLRLHSKRSTHLTAGVGESWRQMAFSSLAGTPDRVNAIMQAFEKNKKLGMISPPNPAYYADKVDFGSNYPRMQLWLQRFNIHIYPTLPIDFPMGSMFWCRPEVLRPWLDQKFTYADFSSTTEHERDGSLAHTLERLLFFGCGIANFSWARIDALP